MKIRHLNKLIGLTFALLFSALAFSGDYGSSQFDTLDQDHNGELSAAEASADENLSQNWTKADQDGSGTIDRAEFSAFETPEADMMEAAPMEEQTQE